MQIRGNPLIKFQNEDRIKKFQKGKMYMKCLNWYREFENLSDNNIVGDSYEAMLNLRDANIIIPGLDINEKIQNGLLKRIHNVAKKIGCEMYANNIRYFDEQINSTEYLISLIEGTYNIAFWKRKKYSYQQEYRILLHGTDIDNDYIELDIGDISDISKICKTSAVRY